MITVYTQPFCGKCRVLKAKLQQKGLAYDESQDAEKMQSLGIMETPAMQVGDKLMTFNEAIQYVNAIKKENVCEY